jgi:hypothetical protein
MPDPGFDRRTPPEPPSGFSFLVGARRLFRPLRGDDLGLPAVRGATEPFVADRHPWTVASHSLDLFEHRFQRMPIVVVFRQAVGVRTPWHRPPPRQPLDNRPRQANEARLFQETSVLK